MHFVAISGSNYNSSICIKKKTQIWDYVIVFGNAVLYSFIQKSAAGRFFEYTANSAGGERLHREGETSRSRGETGNIVLLNEI